MVMKTDFDFNWSIMDTIAGGKSALDIPGLEIDSENKAHLFLKSYGFDSKNPRDIEKLWYYHRRSVVLMTERLGYSLDEIPEVLRDRKSLVDITKLLFYATPKNSFSKEYQVWSCAILRCIHVFVHTENDLFTSYSEEIQKQVLSDFQKFIYHDGQTHKTYLTVGDSKGYLPHETKIELVHFQSKPFKTSSSAVIKLLARPDALAMKIFDKLGVRFVTKDLFDVFTVLRFLLEHQMISFPHTMPDQSSNNLYPVSHFRKALELAKQEKISRADFHTYMEKYLEENLKETDLFRKSNKQTHNDFKFIKFITRKLIHIDKEDKRLFSFFFPYEVQIMDEKSYTNMISGPSNHDSYKERQIKAARNRLFPGN